MRYGNEIKVGIVFLVGLFIIVSGYFYLRGVGLGADLYYLRLSGVAQIAQGNDVRLRGVKIGQVQDVGFDPQTQQPILTLAVRRSKPPFALMHSYQYTIQSAGLIGENYVDIRGPYKANTLTYRPNDPTQFIETTSQNGIFSLANSQEVAKDLTQTLKSFNTTLDRLNKGVLNYQNQQRLAATLEGVTKLTNNASRSFGAQGFKFGLGDPAAQRNLNQTLYNTEVASSNAARAAQNIEAASRQVGGLTQGGKQIIGDVRGNLNTLFRDNRAQLNGLVGNLNKTSYNIAGLTETIAFVFKQGGFKENTQLALGNLRRASENIAVATEGIRSLSGDPQTTSDLKGTLTALRQSTEALRDTAQTLKGAVSDDPTGKTKGIFTSLNTSASNLEIVTQGIANIVGDPSVQSNLKGVAENLNGTLAATRSSTERLNRLLGGRKSRRGSSDSTATPSNTPKSAPPPLDATGVSFTTRGLTDKNRAPNGKQYFGDLDFQTDLLGGPFRLGVDNIGEGNNLTLQSGKFLTKDKALALRYGVYRSKLGAGLELRRGRAAIEGNAYDPNRGKYNVYGGYNLTPNLQLRAGIESFGGHPTPSVELKISR